MSGDFRAEWPAYFKEQFLPQQNRPKSHDLRRFVHPSALILHPLLLVPQCLDQIQSRRVQRHGLHQELRQDVTPSDAIAHVYMEGEDVVQLGIASAVACFERFQPDWRIDGHVGPRGDVAL